jgi:hypothetical protein
MHTLEDGDQQAALATASQSVFSNTGIQQLPGGEDAVLSLGEGADCSSCFPIPHRDLRSPRTASNFLPASPEI